MGADIRQIAFEQDHTYNPTVMPDGRILYLRWDYTDTPHVWNRVLFTMNPDGTGQSEFYGSNSYWPNSLFYRAAHSESSDEVRGDRHRTPRGPRRRDDSLRSGEGTPGDRRRRAANLRSTRARRAADRGQADAAFLAEVSQSLSAERQVLPGLLQADTRFALGNLPGRRLRQSGLAQGRGRPRSAGADPACRRHVARRSFPTERFPSATRAPSTWRTSTPVPDCRGSPAERSRACASSPTTSPTRNRRGSSIASAPTAHGKSNRFWGPSRSSRMARPSSAYRPRRRFRCNRSTKRARRCS